MNKVVYIHRRNDDNSIFYVGMGSEKRPYSKRDRNSYWNNISNKHGFSTEVVAKNLSVKDAYELEIFLINELGRKDLCSGRLVNLTDGGEGGNRPSKLTIEKQIQGNSKSMKKVSQYNDKGLLIDVYRSISFASKQTGVARESIKDCVNGRNKTAGGYAWVNYNSKYIHNEDRFDKGSISMQGGKNPNAKKVMNVLTGIFYDSMNSAFNSQTEYKISAFRAKLSGQNRNTTNFKYI